MKYLYIYIFFTEFIFLVSSRKNDYKFYPNLPAGNYKMFFKGVTRCSVKKDYDIQLNLYLNKISSNTTELRGNLTLITVFDDTYKMHVNMAVKDQIGGWKDNAFIYQAPKGCTFAKAMLGKEFPVILNTFGIHDIDCKVSPGVYVSKGYDLSRIDSYGSLEKLFFYGSYKLRLSFTDKNNKEQGCFIFVVDIKRPWENE